MRFDDVECPAAVPRVGAIVSEWCRACRMVTLHKVTSDHGRECARCRWDEVAQLIGSTHEQLAQLDAAEDAWCAR